MKRGCIMVVLLLLCGSLTGCGPRQTGQKVAVDTTQVPKELQSASEDAQEEGTADAQAQKSEGDDAQAGGTKTSGGKTGEEKLKKSEVKRQLAILEKERSRWLNHYSFEDADGYENIFYTVTDLNQNGQLELLSYICEGSGIFTHYYVNEVTPEGTVEEWRFNNDDGEPGGRLDIGSDMMKLYYDEKEETYAYLCGNGMGGIGGHLYTPGAIKIKDKEVSEETFGCSRFASGGIEYYDDYDGEAKEITREQYNEMVDEATPKGKQGYAYFCWESESYKKLQNISEKKLRGKLSGCYQGFLIRYKNADEPDYKKQVQYLVSQKKEWMKKLPKTIHIDDETIEASYELMAMDLNQDGCMELGILYGSEKQMLVFEVNRDADGMTEFKCTEEIPNFASASAYRSVKDDAIHFVSPGRDFGSDDIYQTKLLDSVLAGGQLKTTLISQADEMVDDDGEVASTSYYNGENEKITKQEYDNVNESFYKDLTPMKLYVQSIISDGYCFDFKSLNDISDEELGDKLQEGIDSFLLD